MGPCTFRTAGFAKRSYLREAAPKKVTIIDPMTKTIYLLDEEKKAFKVLPWDSESALISQALKRFEKHKLVESKTIDGQECEDFEIQPKDKDIKPFYLFVNKDTRFPVQLTTEDPDPSKRSTSNGPT